MSKRCQICNHWLVSYSSCKKCSESVYSKKTLPPPPPPKKTLPPPPKKTLPPPSKKETLFTLNISNGEKVYTPGYRNKCLIFVLFNIFCLRYPKYLLNDETLDEMTLQQILEYFSNSIIEDIIQEMNKQFSDIANISSLKDALHWEIQNWTALDQLSLIHLKTILCDRRHNKMLETGDSSILFLLKYLQFSDEEIATGKNIFHHSGFHFSIISTNECPQVSNRYLKGQVNTVETPEMTISRLEKELENTQDPNTKQLLRETISSLKRE